MTLRVLFFHGLEGSPTGHKPQRLRAMAHVEVVAPALPTGPLVEWMRSHGLGAARPKELIEPSLEVARHALAETKPDVVVGSSFGGGVSLWLACTGQWAGPLVLLAPAAAREFAPEGLQARGGRVVILHGRHDEVIAPRHSLELAERSQADVTLWLVDDDHRLTKSVDAGLMDEAVRFATHGRSTS
jgi:pimeloyl-ACP methyl ester carboxylesterase